MSDMIDFKTSEEIDAPTLHHGDWLKEDNINNAIKEEIRNGLFELEHKLLKAPSNDIRVNIITETFKNYPCIKNFSVVNYNNVGDYEFKYEVEVL